MVKSINFSPIKIRYVFRILIIYKNMWIRKPHANYVWKFGEGFSFKKLGPLTKGFYFIFWSPLVEWYVRDACTHLLHISFVNPYRWSKLGPKKDWIRHYQPSDMPHHIYLAHTWTTMIVNQIRTYFWDACSPIILGPLLQRTVKIVHTYPRRESNETHCSARVSFLVIWVSQIFFTFLIFWNLFLWWFWEDDENVLWIL